MTKRCLAIGILFAACSQQGSLGEYPESSGTAVDDGATDDASSTSAPTSTDPSATDNGDTVEGGVTGSSEDTNPSSSDTGSVACAQPGNCSEYSPCEGENLCGTLDSLFDADGCVRQECQDDEQCADDERCYRAMDFGGCAPSGVFCEDDPELQTCLCGSNPECGGGFCVPESLYPAASPLPGGVSFATVTCASLGDKNLDLQWGGFAECDPDEPVLTLRLRASYRGMFDIDDSARVSGIGSYTASDLTTAEVLTATGELLPFDDETVSGYVEITLAPNADGIQVMAGDLELPVCGEVPMCI